ncbi:class I adenylate-forming enzyme family protein [Capillimicrobium parvum]|uniref:Long-chain-fatty-acid--CoA ligase n=1 Tax=Capillimicrobium parvum TaxID=2884022 RepID=A0A9E7BZD3_9ACTN|nr:AMP-binding protein [Capillimicrobium parvum]UGS34439.1 Long-chain-fatty-acid--CoA ligase [Capillimicrobium parvum]
MDAGAGTEGLDLSGAMVPDLIGHATRRFPDKPAVDLDGTTLTFAEVSDRASRFAAVLRARGIAPGRRVATLMLNELEWLEIRVGAQRAGVILVPLNYRLAEAELAAMLEDCEPDLLVAGPEFAELGARMPVPALLRIGAPASEGPESYGASTAAATPLPAPSGFAPEAICQISYTSGTTGRPKGVMLSNRAVHAGTIAMGHELGAHPYATFLAVTPLFHIGSQVGTSCTYLGGTLVQSRRFDPAEFVETLGRTRATHCQLVPAMAQMVLDRWDERAGGSLQRILYGAAPMAPALLREALATWGCEFVNGYGSTESTGISALAPHEHDPDRLPHLLGSVGRSFALSVPRLVDEEDRDVGPGEIGEVLARSPAMMSGYWRNPDATAEALRGGFMHTGDLGYRDEQGYLYLVDRRNDKIVTGGENVFPSEVEHVIGEHPAVREAGVIGVPDRTWGEAVAAVVVVGDDGAVSADELAAHCRARLAGYKVPKQIRFVSGELPRTPTGKLLRRELRRTWPSDGG